jgi:hypothetical protein
MSADSNAFGYPISRAPLPREACPEPVEWVGTFAKLRRDVAQTTSNLKYKLPEVMQ